MVFSGAKHGNQESLTFYTVTEAAKKLGITRTAVHDAIKKGRLEAKWGETVQVIRKKSLLISPADLKNYRVDASHSPGNARR